MRTDPDMAMLFFDFVNERHRIWEQRQAGTPQPWTEDPILASRKFTNVYRWLDPGSQFVINDLLEDEPTDIDFLLRCFLYRHTGRVEAWEYLSLVTGYPTRDNLSEVLAAWKAYRGVGVTTKKPPRREGQVGPGNGNQSTKFDRPIFTGAYLVFPQSTVAGTDKLTSILLLTQRLVENETFDRFINVTETQAARFNVLKANKGVADFMSMQVLTDFGYRTDFREDEFVVCGPGATRGAAHIEPTTKPEDVVRWAHEILNEDGPLVSHPDDPDEVYLPSLMDVQNCLCEFSKYVRYMSKDHPKPYHPAHPGPQPAFVVPRRW